MKEKIRGHVSMFELMQTSSSRTDERFKVPE